MESLFHMTGRLSNYSYFCLFIYLSQSTIVCFTLLPPSAAVMEVTAEMIIDRGLRYHLANKFRARVELLSTF